MEGYGEFRSEFRGLVLVSVKGLDGSVDKRVFGTRTAHEYRLLEGDGGRKAVRSAG